MNRHGLEENRARFARARVLDLLPLCVFLAVIGTVLVGFVLANDLCCADDASFAIVSKNLAEGKGYSLSIRYTYEPNFAPQPFDPLIGTGPTSIVPVAIAINIFGNSPWLPGFTHVFLELLIFGAISAVLLRYWSSFRVLGFSVLVVLLWLAATPFHFEHWYAQLGEALAALLVILGAVSWFLSGNGRVSALISGCSFSLAFLAKELAAIYVFCFAASIFVVSVATAQTNRSAALQRVFCWGIALALPIAIFEGVKLFVLGADGWVENWQAHLAFMRLNGVPPTTVPIAQLFKERAGVMEEGYGLPIWAALLGIVVIMALVRSVRESKLRALILWISAAGLAHVGYWLFLSNGWPRYLFIAVVVLCFAFGLAIFAAERQKIWVVGLLFGFLSVFLGSERVGDLVRTRLYEELPPPSAKLASARAVLDYLEKNSKGENVYTESWAGVAALEYLSQKVSLFRGQYGIDANVKEGGFYFVTHQKFTNFQNPDTADIVRKCHLPRFVAPPYVVYRCH